MKTVIGLPAQTRSERRAVDDDEARGVRGGRRVEEQDGQPGVGGVGGELDAGHRAQQCELADGSWQADSRNPRSVRR